MAFYETIHLEKGMYAAPGKSFSQILEELDPSQNYEGSPLGKLDAYQRQLKRFDIRVSGPGSDLVEKFFQTSDSAALFPEYISRAIRQGQTCCPPWWRQPPASTVWTTVPSPLSPRKTTSH